MKSSKSNKKVNILKGIAILMVVASHLAPNISQGTQVVSLVCNYYGGILGRVGVLSFLVISGLLYANNEYKDYTRIKTVDFVLNKIKNIYVLYFCALLVCTIIYLVFEQENNSSLLPTFIIHVGMLQSFVPTKGYMFAYQLNEPMWYISMMLFIWITLKPTIIALKKVRRKSIYLIITACTFVIQGVWLVGSSFVIQDLELLKWMTYVNPVFCYSVFLFSYCLALLMREQMTKNKKTMLPFLVLNIVLVICLFVMLPIVPLCYRLYVMEIPVAVLLNYIYLGDFNFESKIATILEFIGKRSSTVFIVHFVPILIFRKLDTVPYVLGTAMTIIMMIIFTEIYEFYKKTTKKRG